MASFLSAKEVGADAIEFDVHMTEDGRLVVVHDYDLSRTTSGTGLVHHHDLDYVRALSAGRWFADEFESEKVPLLEEVLDLDGVKFELEVKGLPTPLLISGIADAISNANVADKIEITGFHYVALQHLQRLCPDARFGLFPKEFEPWMSYQLYEEILIDTALTGGFDVVHIPAQNLGRFDAEHFHDAGLLLHASDPTSDAEYVDALDHCDQLSTNDPRTAIEMRSRYV